MEMKRSIHRCLKLHKVGYSIIGMALILFVLQFLKFSDTPFRSEIFDNVDTNNVIIDIKIQECLRFFGKCNIPSGWSRVSKPLNLHSKYFTMYDYHLLVRREPFSLVTRIMSDFQISTSPFSPTDNEWVLQGYHNLILWKQYVNSNGPDFEDIGLIRDVNVLFGANDLRDARENWYFQHQEIPLPFDTLLQVHLSLFKLSVADQPQYVQNLTDFDRMKRDGKIIINKPRLKVMQLSDLHFSSDYNNCNARGCRLDTKTLKFIESSIKAEDIDFVVITGDLIDQYKINDFKSVILKGLAPILHRKIPFVFTFGELDFNEYSGLNPSLVKYQFLQFISTLPNCYNYVPSLDTNIHGLTNYNLKVFRELESDPSAILSILDSEEHRIDGTQINSLYRYNQELPKNIFKLLFFHYPLPNFRPSGKFKLVGSYNEKHALNAKTSHSYRDDIVNCGYNVIAVGHEHENDACILSNKASLENGDLQNEMWLCYNGITGDSGTTKIDEKFERRLRIFEMNFDNKRLISWKRSEATGAGFDYQIIRQFV